MEQQKVRLMVLVGVLIVVAIGAGAYFVSQNGIMKPVLTPAQSVPPSPSESPDLTASWNVYNNNKYSYSVQYPENFAQQEFDNGTGISLSVDGNVIMHIDALSRSGSDMTLPFADYVKIAAISEIEGYESLKSSEEVVTNSGEVGYKTIWNGTTPDGVARLFLPITYFDTRNANNDTVQITLWDEKYLDVYNQILSTFKFIK